MRHAHDNRIYYKPALRKDWTFELKGAFLDKIPKRYPGEGEPATHSENGEVKLRVFGGNVTQLDETTFKVHGDWRFGNRFAILAHHEGDDVYRYSAQHLLVKSEKLIRGKRNGKPQWINFELDTGSDQILLTSIPSNSATLCQNSKPKLNPVYPLNSTWTLAQLTSTKTASWSLKKYL